LFTGARLGDRQMVIYPWTDLFADAAK